MNKFLHFVEPTGLWLCTIISMVERVITTAMLGRCDKLMIIFNYISRLACITLFTAYKYYLVIPTSPQVPDGGATSTVLLVYCTVLQLNCCTFKLSQVTRHQSQLWANNPALAPFSGFGSVWGFGAALCPGRTFCDWHHNRTVPGVSPAPQTYDIMTS